MNNKWQIEVVYDTIKPLRWIKVQQENEANIFWSNILYLQK